VAAMRRHSHRLLGALLELGEHPQRTRALGGRIRHERRRAPTPLFTPLLYLAIHFTAIFHYSAACPSEQIDAFDTRGDGKPDAFDTNGDGQIDQTVSR
jgi:hypothetical protein